MIDSKLVVECDFVARNFQVESVRSFLSSPHEIFRFSFDSTAMVIIQKIFEERLSGKLGLSLVARAAWAVAW